MQPEDFARVRSIVTRQAAADLSTRLVAHNHGIPFAEAALHLSHAGRKQTLTRSKRLRRAGVDRQRALRRK